TTGWPRLAWSSRLRAKRESPSCGCFGWAASAEDGCFLVAGRGDPTKEATETQRSQRTSGGVVPLCASVCSVSLWRRRRSRTRRSDPDHDLAEVGLARHVLERGARLREREHAVHDRPHRVLGDRAVHLLEALAAAHDHALDPDVLHEDRIERDLTGGAEEHADEADSPADADRPHRLVERPRAPDLDHMVGADTSGQLLHPLRPVGRRLVVDRLPRPELPEPAEPLLPARGR